MMDSNGNRSNWTLIELRLWLKQREKKLSGNKRKLTERINGYMAMSHVEPEPGGCPDQVNSADELDDAGVCVPSEETFQPIRDVSGLVLHFTIANLTKYFIDRKVRGDKVSDVKNLHERSIALFKHGHVQKIFAKKEGEYVFVRSVCLPEYKKTTGYKITVRLHGESADITYAECGCPAGKAPHASCKHLASLGYALEEFVRLNTSSNCVICTDKLQTWNQLRGIRLEPKKIDGIDW